MSKLWSDVARQLEPYVPGEQPQIPGLVKLNTNEHPLAPSTLAMEALRNVAGESLRKYPDPESTVLRKAIAEQEGLSADQVFVGNGSDEVLGHVFQALLVQEDPIASLDITYSFYPVWSTLYGAEIKKVPLLEDFTVDVDALCREPGPILIANPNAPTGIALSQEDVARLAASNPNRVVVIDEAYYGFGIETASALIADYPNLLVTRTLSKSHALAGLRLGYALGNQTLIEGLIRVKDSFNSYPIDAVAQSVGTAAINDTAWLNDASQTVIANRESLREGLQALGFKVLPSAANFLFVEHPSVSGELLFNGLREDKVLVRRWSKPRIENFLRITVGTREQNQALLDSLTRQLQS